MIWKRYVKLLTVTLEAKMWIRLYVSRTMILELQLLSLELSLQLVPLSLPSNFASIAMQKVSTLSRLPTRKTMEEYLCQM